jgi:hypothetical protein
MDELSLVLPFTREVLFRLFATYNEEVWPAPVVAGLLGVVALALVVHPAVRWGWLPAAILAGIWAWNGAVYHFQYFATINFMAPGFAVAFVLEALLLAWAGVVRRRLRFRFRRSVRGWAGLALAAYGLGVYPLTSVLSGHAWPAMPVFGVAPGPTTVFTLGLLLLAEERIPVHLVAIPLLWTLVGGSAAWLLDVPEDLALPAAGLLLVGVTRVALRRDRRKLRADRDDV